MRGDLGGGNVEAPPGLDQVERPVDIRRDRAPGGVAAVVARVHQPPVDRARVARGHPDEHLGVGLLRFRFNRHRTPMAAFQTLQASTQRNHPSTYAEITPR